jgi:hypothetical protein
MLIDLDAVVAGSGMMPAMSSSKEFSALRNSSLIAWDLGEIGLPNAAILEPW